MALYSINELGFSGPAVCKRFVLWVYYVGIFWDLPPLGHSSFLPLSSLYFCPHKLLTSCLLPGGVQRSHLLWCVKDVGCSLQDKPVTHRKCSFTNVFWHLSPLASFCSCFLVPLGPKTAIHTAFLQAKRPMSDPWEHPCIFSLLKVWENTLFLAHIVLCSRSLMQLALSSTLYFSGGGSDLQPQSSLFFTDANKIPASMSLT